MKKDDAGYHDDIMYAMNKSLQTLFIYNGILVLATSMFGSLYAVYVLDIENSPAAVGISSSAFLISSTIFVFFVSKIGDKIKKKEHLWISGFLVKALVWLLYIAVSNFAFLIMLQILLGLGEALSGPTYNALVAEHLDSQRYVKNYSDQYLIFNLIGAASIALGGFIVASLGFTTLFLIMSGLAMVPFFGLLLKPRGFS